METTGATLQHVNEHPKFDSVSVLKSWHDLGGMSHSPCTAALVVFVVRQIWNKWNCSYRH